VIGDHRWAGMFGVQADFIAKSHCSVEFIPTDEVNVIVIISYSHPQIQNSQRKQ